MIHGKRGRSGNLSIGSLLWKCRTSTKNIKLLESRFGKEDREDRMETFEDNDEEYLQRVDSHSNGFVVNSYRQPEATYLKLHSARCGTIKTPQRTNWTIGTYIKICVLDRRELDV
jgi:hypothetical protein